MNNNNKEGSLDGSVKHLSSTQVMIPGFWGHALSRAPCLVGILIFPLLVISLINQIFLKNNKGYMYFPLVWRPRRGGSSLRNGVLVPFGVTAALLETTWQDVLTQGENRMWSEPRICGVLQNVGSLHTDTKLVVLKKSELEDKEKFRNWVDL